jgi:hypothetical protein
MAETRIAYPDDPVMAIAWRDHMVWAGRNPEILAAFRLDTGCATLWAERRDGLALMIDQATGFDRECAARFVDWVNKNLWGEDPFAAPSEGSDA